MLFGGYWAPQHLITPVRNIEKAAHIQLVIMTGHYLADDSLHTQEPFQEHRRRVAPQIRAGLWRERCVWRRIPGSRMASQQEQDFWRPPNYALREDDCQLPHCVALLGRGLRQGDDFHPPDMHGIVGPSRFIMLRSARVLDSPRVYRTCPCGPDPFTPKLITHFEEQSL